MAKDDYFKLVYAILTELYECKKSGTKIPPDAIHPERFGIPVSYWLDIMEELLDAGYTPQRPGVISLRAGWTA